MHRYIQTNFGFFGNPTAERTLEGETLKVTVTQGETARTFTLPLLTIWLELNTLQHEIRGE